MDEVGSRLDFAESVARTLDEHPRWLDCRFLYDAAGSEIFERITEQPEYYQTRAEDALLVNHADEIRALTGEQTLVELGSGSSSKTRRLIEAWLRQGPSRYVPSDVSETALQQACATLSDSYPDLTVKGLLGDYETTLAACSEFSPLTLVFLGSTIGNLNEAQLDRFLGICSAALSPGDCFLLGIDLVKDHKTLEAAYNDEAGCSADFTQNIFVRMNRELQTQIPLDAIEHVAFYNDRLERIEIFARFNRTVEFRIPSIDRSIRIAGGEMINTEISRKFRVDNVFAGFSRFGFQELARFKAPDDSFSTLLFQRQQEVPVQIERHIGFLKTLRHQRTQTKALVAPLPERVLMEQHNPLLSPIAWDLGHIANFEQRWLLDGLGLAVSDGDGQPPVESIVRGANTLYDADATPRHARGDLCIPAVNRTTEYMDEVRIRVERYLVSDGVKTSHPLANDGFVFNLVAQHEAWHQETMLQAIQSRVDIVYQPFDEQTKKPDRPDSSIGREVLIPTGPCWIGTNDRERSYDNERPKHRVHLPSFYIDESPVTNGDYLFFIEDGGYERRHLWDDAGWAWRSDTQAQSPEYWSRIDNGWHRCKFGQWFPIDHNRPVMHVSWFEASAYARWKNKRLPSEFEWEKAAAWNGATMDNSEFPWGAARPTEDLLNADHRWMEPMPVGSFPHGRSFYGCCQMLGDVWEWTSSAFTGYPGFEVFPYREYSEVFFGEDYRVLRGGSWATGSVLLRNTLRSWDFPQRRQIFSGFRCARDA